MVDRPTEDFTIQEDEVEQIAWIPREKLEQELKDSPDNYIEAMRSIVALFP